MTDIKVTYRVNGINFFINMKTPLFSAAILGMHFGPNALGYMTREIKHFYDFMVKITVGFSSREQIYTFNYGKRKTIYP